MAFKKNTAVTGFPFGLISKTDGSDVTAGTTNCFVILDGGTQTAATNSPVHEGLGQWTIDLTASEMNGDIVGLVFTNASAITQQVTIGTVGKLVSELNDFDSTAEEVLADIIKVSGSTVAADNLELQYDGTGLIGDNYPSTQRQVSNLTVGAGGISTIADGITITTGNQTGTYTSTFALDGVYHTLTPSGGVIDAYYEFNVGVAGVATEILWDGYIQGNNDDVQVYGWDWISSGWVKIGSLDGANGVVVQTTSFIVTSGMTGTDANAGNIRFRFGSSNANNINSDRILCEYTALADSAFILHSGIAQGGATNTITLDTTASNIDDFHVHSRVINKAGTGAGQENIITDYDGTTKVATVKFPWKVVPDSTTVFNITPAQTHSATASGGYENNTVYIDPVTGNSGTQIGVNGTIDNPSDNLPDARDVADSQGVNSNRFEFVRSPAGVVLDQDYLGWIFSGRSPLAIDLGGNDVSLSSFVELVVSGTCTNNVGISVYDTCGISNLTCGEANFLKCGLVNTLTLSQSGKTYSADRMWSNAESLTSNPVIVFSSDGVSGITFEGNALTGAYTISGMKTLDTLKVFGDAAITLDSSNTGGTVVYSGDVVITDNSTVSPTFNGGVIKNNNDIITLVDAKVDVVGTTTSDTNTKVTSIQSDYSTFDFTSDQVIVSTNNDKTGYSITGSKTTLDALNDITAEDVLTTTMTESYSSDGAEFTLAQGMYLTVQNLQDFSFSGVTQTVNQLDGTTVAATYTLDDAVTPTSKTRTT